MKNKLFYGDNLEVLRKFIRDDSIDLCYIDPPFNSKRNYNQIYNNIGREDIAQTQAFTDTWTWDDHANECLEIIYDNAHGTQTDESIQLTKGLEAVLKKGSLLAYIVSMTVRIAEIHRVLKETGSFYLHCDPTASHYLKLVCDAIFCSRGGDFLNEITWKRTSAHSDSNRFGANSDTILFYAKSGKFVFNTQFQPYSEEYKARFSFADQDGRKWTDDNLTAKGLSGGGYDYEYKGVTSLWRCPLKTMERLDSEGRLHFTKNGGIRLKRYLDELSGMPSQAVWDDISPINSQAKERLGYPTQKPEALLERIIKASSNKGEIVLDAYCGCGTTIAVAQRLKRKWIGIDITYQSIALILGTRLVKLKGALDNLELHGIPKDMQSVKALIHKNDDRVRKEFEKWAVLTYSDNKATINEKKGADKGIDGTAYITMGRNEKGELASSTVIISVKSGKVGSAFMRDLLGTMEREKAVGGILITLEEPTKPMFQEAKAAGQTKGDFATIDRLKIVTVQEILDGERMNLPMFSEVVKKAQTDSGLQQQDLFGEAEED
jgi:DNA modification methylase